MSNNYFTNKERIRKDAAYNFQSAGSAIMMSILLNMLILSGIIYLIARFLPAVHVKNFGTAVVVAIVYSLLNFFLGWFLGYHSYSYRRNFCFTIIRLSYKKENNKDNKIKPLKIIIKNFLKSIQSIFFIL